MLQTSECIQAHVYTVHSKSFCTGVTPACRLDQALCLTVMGSFDSCFVCMQAILRATKSSFAAMKKRLGGISTSSGNSAERPFFDVSVELSVPRVTMNPTLDDIQAAINATAKKVSTHDLHRFCHQHHCGALQCNTKPIHAQHAFCMQPCGKQAFVYMRVCNMQASDAHVTSALLFSQTGSKGPHWSC